MILTPSTEPLDFISVEGPPATKVKVFSTYPCYKCNSIKRFSPGLIEYLLIEHDTIIPERKRRTLPDPKYDYVKTRPSCNEVHYYCPLYHWHIAATIANKPTYNELVRQHEIYTQDGKENEGGNTKIYRQFMCYICMYGNGKAANCRTHILNVHRLDVGKLNSKNPNFRNKNSTIQYVKDKRGKTTTTHFHVIIAFKHLQKM